MNTKQQTGERSTLVEDTTTECRYPAFLHTRPILQNQVFYGLAKFNIFATTEGLSIFLVASRFNNACPKRNKLEFAYNKAKQCLVLKANQDIPAETELTIFYGGTPVLFQKWGFRCTYGACQLLADE
ncbi:hypothetical protein MGN70_003375 [Eutypa lata]|nr:hypothetical protein MGN70_003375 [Eutypa lata]